MSNFQLSAKASELIGELEADVEVDTVALQRVRRNLQAALSGVPLPPPRRLPIRSARRLRQAWMSRAGIGAALLVGTAFGAGGAALVSELGSQARVVESPPRLVTTQASNRQSPHTVPMSTQRSAPAMAEAPAPSPPAHPREMVTRGTPSSGRSSAPLDTTAAPQLVPPRQSLDTEMRALDDARGALRAGEAGRALGILRVHAATHATSNLSQERDALLVRALVASGQYAEARALGRLFETQHPGSILLPAVEHALAAIP